jgi:5-methylcytosine-specific restriction endonuclease McrA
VLSYKKVLVLNKSWRPISIIGLEKAFSKIFASYSDGSPKAKIIDACNDFRIYDWREWSQLSLEEGEFGLRTVSAVYKCPEIILYTRYDKVPCLKASFNRRTIYRRDNNTCQYCGIKMTNDELSLDHIVPKCQGGVTNWENIVVACLACNSRKAGRTPKQAGMNLLKDPKRPRTILAADEIKIKSWEYFLSDEHSS